MIFHKEFQNGQFFQLFPDLYKGGIKIYFSIYFSDRILEKKWNRSNVLTFHTSYPLINNFIFVFLKNT